jgi:hypothetical protein
LVATNANFGPGPVVHGNPGYFAATTLVGNTVPPEGPWNGRLTTITPPPGRTISHNCAAIFNVDPGGQISNTGGTPLVPAHGLETDCVTLASPTTISAIPFNFTSATVSVNEFAVCTF